MRRPAVGMALLLMAGLSVAVVPALRPTVIDGTAAAVPVLGIPAVGDCVTEPIPYSSLWIALHNPTDDGTVTYPALNIEPCDGPRYGEVVAVIPVPAIATVKVNGKTRSIVDDRNQDQCWSASAVYLGIDTGPAADAQWMPILSPPSLVSQPSARQTAEGQIWLACLTYTQSADEFEQQDDGNTGAESFIPYSGTLRDALTTGNQTDYLGSCGDQFPMLDIEPGSCGRPHRYQQLAIAPSGTADAKSATLTKTCTDTVNASIGRDVTGSSDLEVVVTATDNFGSPTPASDTIPANSSLQCGVAATGARLLTASLIGLGDRPIPWS